MIFKTATASTAIAHPISPAGTVIILVLLVVAIGALIWGLSCLRGGIKDTP